LIPELGSTRDEWLFSNLPLFDIFDEVDALMTPKKYFIYSIGNCSTLQADRLRYELSRVMLEIICRELFEWLYTGGMVVADEPL
jgi:hypothetical protein